MRKCCNVRCLLPYDPRRPATKYADSQMDEFSYIRTDLRHICLEPKTLARCCPLDSTHDSQFTAGRPKDSKLTIMGTLDILPAEMLTMILLNLDLQSLTVLRRVSQGSRLAVDTLPQYQSIRTHGPELLRATLSLNIANSTTLLELYSALTTASCFLCGDFGAFVYMLSCKRVCFLCLTQRPEVLPMIPSHARDRYGLDNKALSGLPKMRSLPGVYSQGQTRHRNRKALVDPMAAEEAGIALHGSREQMSKIATDLRSSSQANWQKKMLKYEHTVKCDPTIRKPARPPSHSTFDGGGENPHRFMGILRVPWLNRRCGQTEMGLSCTGCARGESTNQDFYRRSLDWRRQYSHADILQHVQTCEFSQERLASIGGLFSQSY